MNTSIDALFARLLRQLRARILTYSHIRCGSARGASSPSHKNHASRGIHISLSSMPSSCGKYFITDRIGFGAAWPSPQIDASIITVDKSFNCSISQSPLSMMLTAFSQPTRQGVHWPQENASPLAWYYIGECPRQLSRTSVAKKNLDINPVHKHVFCTPFFSRVHSLRFFG